MSSNRRLRAQMLPSDLDTSAANKKQSIPPIRKETPYHQFSSKFIHIYSHSQVDTWANEVQGEGFKFTSPHHRYRFGVVLNTDSFHEGLWWRSLSE